MSDLDDGLLRASSAHSEHSADNHEDINFQSQLHPEGTSVAYGADNHQDINLQSQIPQAPDVAAVDVDLLRPLPKIDEPQKGGGGGGGGSNMAMGASFAG